MTITPYRIFSDFRKKHLNRQSAVNLLTDLIENSEDRVIRVKSLIYLEKIGLFNEDVFNLLESLLISDSNNKIRMLSAILLRDHFEDVNIISIMKWAIKYESDYECAINLIKILKQMNNFIAKKILINEVKKIKKQSFIDNDRQYTNKIFKKQLNKVKNYDIHRIAEILINYKTISAIISKFYTVFFEWQDALINKLDLSEIGWNVNIWRQRYSNRISSLSEIIGLNHLNNLKYLDVSNNRLTHFGELIQLKSLTHLNLSNNRLQDKSNIEYLRKMKNLRYLDISSNKLAELIKREEFPHINIILNKGTTFFTSGSIF